MKIIPVESTKITKILKLVFYIKILLIMTSFQVVS